MAMGLTPRPCRLSSAVRPPLLREVCMPDVLTVAERAAIDAAVAAGRVRKIDRGVSGECEYQPRAGYVSAGPRNGNAHARLLRKAEIEARRVRIIALRRDGLTQERIAALLGVHAQTVVVDMRALRLTGRLA